MPGFNLDDYEPVADRIERFWKDHPTGSILTDLTYHDEKRFIVKATVWVARALDPEKWGDLPPSATGYAEEIIGSTNVNRTSALENCETSAIGRALANLGYAVKNRASREEMEKVQGRERARSGGRKMTPSPERPPEAPQTNGNGEGADEVRRLKQELLDRSWGNKAEAAIAWTRALAFFGLDIKEPVPPDMIGVLEAHLKGVVTEAAE